MQWRIVKNLTILLTVSVYHSKCMCGCHQVCVCVTSDCVSVISYCVCVISYSVCVISYRVCVISYCVCVTNHCVCVTSYNACVIVTLYMSSVTVYMSMYCYITELWTRVTWDYTNNGEDNMTIKANTIVPRLPLWTGEALFMISKGRQLMK